jgi:hypothetical protein
VSARLPIDGAVLGYWGWDEANETDPAVDGSAQGRQLAVQNAPAVVPARLGNGRQFNGVSTRADPADSRPFWVRDLTIIVWATLDSVLQTGSRRRTIVACDAPDVGPTTTHGTLYYLGVTDDGRIIFEHHDSSGRLISFRTAPGAMRIKRYYSISLAREANDLTASVQLRLNNEPVAWADVDVDGVPWVAPEEHPDPPAPFEPHADGVQTLKVGISARHPDAWWHGVLDELSLHGVARQAQPYLQAAYFRLTLQTSFSRLTATGGIRTIGGTEMGGGTRWWCYERDQSLYVIRENSLGLFSPEVLLTTNGQLANGATVPGGVEQPRLAYDSDSDTLFVAFVSAGRVYKVTATSEDAPTTQNMPNTQDTAAIVKATEQREIVRLASGGEAVAPANEPVVGTGVVYDGTAPPSVAFVHTPSFGIAVGGSSVNGYFVYRLVGGIEQLYATVRGDKQTERIEASGNYWFVPVLDRVYGATYYARPRSSAGQVGGRYSNMVVDFFGLMHTQDGDDNALVLSRYGDGTTDFVPPPTGGEGAGLLAVNWITRTPVKIPLADVAAVSGGGDAIHEGFYGTVTRTPVKAPVVEVANIFVGGESQLLSMARSDGPRFDA